MKIAREMLERRRASQRCKDQLGEEDWAHMMSALPMLLGLISDLPLEQAFNDLVRAQSLGPFLDPTLYQKYVYSRKGDELKEMLNAMIRVKALTLDQTEASLDAEAEVA